MMKWKNNQEVLTRRVIGRLSYMIQEMRMPICLYRKWLKLILG